MNQFNQGTSLDSRNRGGFASLAPQGYWEQPLAKQFIESRSPMDMIAQYAKVGSDMYSKRKQDMLLQEQRQAGERLTNDYINQSMDGYKATYRKLFSNFLEADKNYNRFDTTPIPKPGDLGRFDLMSMTESQDRIASLPTEQRDDTYVNVNGSYYPRAAYNMLETNYNNRLAQKKTLGDERGRALSVLIRELGGK